MEMIFDDLSDNIHETAKDASKRVAKDTAKEVRSTSPINEGSIRAGRYKRGWRYKEEYEGQWYVYNQTDWQLTHLLNDGHNIKNRFSGVRVIGHYGGNQHIDHAEAFAARELPIRISRGLK